MKAISLWQPWATAMEVGAKLVETRGWRTSYRGYLVICAAQKRIKPADIPLDVHRWMRQSLGRGDDIQKILDSLPYGKALCVVRLCDCRDGFEVWRSGIISETEAALGAYHDQGYPCGRVAWMTRDLRVLKEPIPVKGKQSLFDLPPEVEAQVRAQL